MKDGIRSLAIAAMMSALCCTPAYAATKITTVTGDFNATNGCTVRSVAGYGGYGFNVTVWGVDCPNDPEVYPEKVETWYEWGGYWCEMRTYTSGYYVTGQCGNYSVWRN